MRSLSPKEIDLNRSNPPKDTELSLTATQCAGLVECIGSTRCVPALLELAHEVCGADFVSVFCQGDRDLPLSVGTDGRKGKQRAERAAQGYTRHMDEDPNTVLLSGRKGEGDFLTSQNAADIKSFTYRRDCYDLPGIAGRISLVRRTSTYGLCVSLYSAEESGVFDPPSHKRAAAVLPFLLAAVERHVAFSLKGSVWMEQDIQARLALSYPGLTHREREVAAMAIKGRTAAQTAQILGLAETTIITHRKNAYKRMNVGSLRQLVAKF